MIKITTDQFFEIVDELADLKIRRCLDESRLERITSSFKDRNSLGWAIAKKKFAHDFSEPSQLTSSKVQNIINNCNEIVIYESESKDRQDLFSFLVDKIKEFHSETYIGEDDED